MLKERLAQDLKDAMRAKDRTRLNVVRSLTAAITEREKAGKGPLTNDDLVDVVQKQAKQRREAMGQYQEAGRDDLAQTEADELAWIEQYLPKQLSEDEIMARVHEIVQRTGATSTKDMGRVMGEAMQVMRGVAEGNRVRETVEKVLRRPVAEDTSEAGT